MTNGTFIGFLVPFPILLGTYITNLHSHKSKSPEIGKKFRCLKIKPDIFLINLKKKHKSTYKKLNEKFISRGWETLVKVLKSVKSKFGPDTDNPQ